MKLNDLKRIFDSHQLTDEQGERVSKLRLHAKQFAGAVLRHCPKSAEQTLAIRKLEETLHYAVASIAREPTVDGKAVEERFGLFDDIEGKLTSDQRRKLAGFLGLSEILGVSAYEGEENGEKEKEEN